MTAEESPRFSSAVLVDTYCVLKIAIIVPYAYCFETISEKIKFPQNRLSCYICNIKIRDFYKISIYNTRIKIICGN